jgi:hypothetical protein
MKRLTVRAIAAVAVAASSWSAAAVTTAAGAAPSISHHPRISAGVPRTAGWASSNWSGYAVTGGPFTAATGQWTVPSVAPSRKSTFSSSWVGIDGFNNSNLIQTGTEQDYYNGSAHYDAWWEILPAAETVITGMTIGPGDKMSASISRVSGSTFTITISDTSRNESFTINQTYTGPLTSVEWIQEAPTVGGHVATLATYSSPTTFDPGTANGGNPGLTTADSGVMIQQSRQVSTPSVPDHDTDGFNISYGSTAPSAPAS